MGEAEMCFFNIFLLKLNNLQTKRIFAYVLDLVLNLMKEKPKMIRVFVQFDKSKRPNI